MSASYTLLATLEGHTQIPWSVSWHPTLPIIASCGGDKVVRLWQATRDITKPTDQQVWSQVNTLDGSHNRTVRQVSWSPGTGKYLASAGFDGTVSIFKMNGIQGNLLTHVEGHENEVKSIDWQVLGDDGGDDADAEMCEDGCGCHGQPHRATLLLATCGRDRTVWVWGYDEIHDFECISVIHAHSQDVKRVRFHPYRQLLASCSYDNTIKLYHEKDRDWTEAHTLEGHTGTVWDVAWVPEYDVLCSVSDDNSMRVYQKNGDGYRCIQTLADIHERTPYSIDTTHVVLPDKSKVIILATCSADNNVNVYKIVPKSTGQSPEPVEVVRILRFEAHKQDVNAVAFSSTSYNDNNVMLATCGDDMCIKVYKLTIL